METAMDILIIVQDAPYGSERPYQALRMAGALLKIDPDVDLTVYFTGDGVSCLKAGQQTPDGFYNLERMLKPVVRKGMVMACRRCCEARGLTADELVDGARIVRLAEPASLLLDADKVLMY
jgi:uncharacterized protein involved in oxidation of intracellular sulfur